jgi:hypothetical protein
MEATAMDNQVLRKNLTGLLMGGSAHMEVGKTLRELPTSMAEATVSGYRNTPWRLLEHIRIAQWDILEFSRDPDHVSPDFPDGYWPASDIPASGELWGDSVDAICRDLQAMVDLVNDPTTDLFAPIPHGDGRTVLREALLVADHNAYHLGQMMVLRRILEGAEGQTQ